MGSPTSITTKNPEPRGKVGPRSKGTPVAYSDERFSRGPWLSEAPPTGMLTGVLGEMAFYYGACWLHYRSAQRPGKRR